MPHPTWILQGAFCGAQELRIPARFNHSAKAVCQPWPTAAPGLWGHLELLVLLGARGSRGQSHPGSQLVPVLCHQISLAGSSRGSERGLDTSFPIQVGFKLHFPVPATPSAGGAALDPHTRKNGSKLGKGGSVSPPTFKEKHQKLQCFLHCN